MVDGFQRSSFENDAFYKFVMLTNFDNFIANHFNNLITIDKGYFGTHKIPKVGVKYSSNIDLKIAQDWTNDSGMCILILIKLLNYL